MSERNEPLDLASMLASGGSEEPRAPSAPGESEAALAPAVPADASVPPTAPSTRLVTGPPRTVSVPVPSAPSPTSARRSRSRRVVPRGTTARVLPLANPILVHPAPPGPTTQGPASDLVVVGPTGASVHAIAAGRVRSTGDEVELAARDGMTYRYRGLEPRAVDQVHAGDVVGVLAPGAPAALRLAVSTRDGEPVDAYDVLVGLDEPPPAVAPPASARPAPAAAPAEVAAPPAEAGVVTPSSPTAAAATNVDDSALALLLAPPATGDGSPR